MMRTTQLCVMMTSLLMVLPAWSAEDALRNSPAWLLPVPEVKVDERIPALEQVVGHTWAKDVSSHAQIETYLHALSKAAPGRTKLVSYGKTYEGRRLYYLVISAPRNLRRLDSIRETNLRLADPRTTGAEAARRRFERAPALVWLAYSIHGNETSSSDAALLTAYHLLADQRESTRQALQRCVIFIDPLQNPDGRERFINAYRETRGVFPQAEPLASEHTERWPGGRFNHYLFDMNRDWFLQSQQETQRKVAAYLRWQPHIYVDAHEMGSNSTYYFAPAADPVSELVLPRQLAWSERLGRHQASWFDRYGFAFTTREMFDAFFPGYGSEWPTLHGAMGILWEQASVRGLVVRRNDDLELAYHDAVRHHYVSGLATIEFAARHHRELVEHFYQTRVDSIRLGQDGPVREFFLLEGRRPVRAARLAQRLIDNGIEVRQVRHAVAVRAIGPREGQRIDRKIPVGSYHVPVAQPAGRLVRSLLERHLDMDRAFVDRQLDRKARRLDDEIYDVTAWSLPLAFGVDAVATDTQVDVESVRVEAARAGGTVKGAEAKVAYLVDSRDDGVLPALGEWLRAGLRVRVTDQPLTLGDVRMPKGTLILRVPENPPSLHATVATSAREHGLVVHGTDTGYVTEGSHLGGPHVHWVRPPKVLMIVDRPARYAVGHTWHLFDQVMHYPVTRIAGRNLGRVDLDSYNVLILPGGRYAGGDAPNADQVARIKAWVRGGGTLILVQGAAAWACGEKVGILSSAVVKKSVRASSPTTTAASAPTTAPSDKAKIAATEPPDAVPGAFLRASVYDDHWVTFGYDEHVDVMMAGNLILTPLEPNVGRNLVTFVGTDKLLTSGFCWPDTLDLLADTPYVLYQASGDGHVIAFTDDPNLRAMCPGVRRLFLNAVFFGPGH